MAWACFLPVHGNYPLAPAAGLLVMPAGYGMSYPSAYAAATSGVPARQAGLASGLISTAQQMGGAVGLAVISAVAASYTALLTRDSGPQALTSVTTWRWPSRPGLPCWPRSSRPPSSGSGGPPPLGRRPPQGWATGGTWENRTLTGGSGHRGVFEPCVSSSPAQPERSVLPLSASSSMPGIRSPVLPARTGPPHC